MEIPIKKEFVLPEKWCLKNPHNEESILLYNYANNLKESKRNFGYPYEAGTYFHFPNYMKACKTSTEIKKGYTEITFEEFKEYVLKKEREMKEKELIGYKLIKPEYKEAALKLCKVCAFANYENYDFGANSINQKNLKEAGVLDLWFEPVYKNDNPFKVGDWVTCIITSDQYTTKIENFDKEGWIESNVGLPNGNHYHYSQYRLATEDEILESLTDSFIKLHKVKIGDIVDITYNINKEKNNPSKIIKEFRLVQRNQKDKGCFSHLTHKWFSNHPNENYQLLIKTNAGTYNPDCKFTKTTWESLSWKFDNTYNVLINYSEGLVKVGCQTFDYDDVQSLIKIIDAGLKVDLQDQIKLIWKTLNKNK
jgi:hypothetical protein